MAKKNIKRKLYRKKKQQRPTNVTDAIKRLQQLVELGNDDSHALYMVTRGFDPYASGLTRLAYRLQDSEIAAAFVLWEDCARDTGLYKSLSQYVMEFTRSKLKCRLLLIAHAHVSVLFVYYTTCSLAKDSYVTTTAGKRALYRFVNRLVDAATAGDDYDEQEFLATLGRFFDEPIDLGFDRRELLALIFKWLLSFRAVVACEQDALAIYEILGASSYSHDDSLFCNDRSADAVSIKLSRSDDAGVGLYEYLFNYITNYQHDESAT